MIRDFNTQLKDTLQHKYAYNFDLDVMHPFILKSFLPFFKEGEVLELGSSKGDFTEHLSKYFDNITCIEASSDAIEIAKDKNIGKNIVFINDIFENVTLDKKFDNIIFN